MLLCALIWVRYVVREQLVIEKKTQQDADVLMLNTDNDQLR